MRKRASSPRVMWALFSSLLVSILLFAVVAYAVNSGATARWDESVLLAIHAQQNPILDTFFVGFTELGGVITLTIATVSLIAIALIRKRRGLAFFIGASMGGVMVMNLILKSLFDRARPDLWEWIVTESNFSFPSGHATATAAFALIIIALCWHTRWRIVAAVAACGYVVAIGFSRLYLGVHFPTDIIGGWLIGNTWVSLMLLGYIWISRRDKKEVTP